MYLCINVFVECPFSSLQYVQHVRTLSSVMIVAREGRLEQGSHPPIFLTDQLPLFQPGGGQIIRLLIVPPKDIQTFLRLCRATSNVVKKAKHSYVSQRKKLLSLTATNFSTGFIKTDFFQNHCRIKIFANILMSLACHKKSYLICLEFLNFRNIT